MGTEGDIQKTKTGKIASKKKHPIVGGFNGFYGNGLIVGGFNGFCGKILIVVIS